MPLIEAFRMAWFNIWNNRLRSALTLLGIAIGIGSTCSLISLGFGFKAEIFREFESIGENMIMVFPNIFQETGKSLDPLTEQDSRAIKAVCGDEISQIIPFIFAGGSRVEYRNKRTTPQVTGTTGGYLSVMGQKLKYGRFISAADVAVGRRVVVLDWRATEKLFGKLNPVGKNVRLYGQSFTVIGSMLKRDSSVSLGAGGSGLDLYLPVSTLQRVMNFRDYYGFYITVTDVAKTENITERIRSLMVRRYGRDNNIQIFSTKELLTMIQMITTIITVLLGIIGGIALVVGGIGIMNIMLVTVMERVREIGVRKAIGAKQTGILWQFLTESVILCFVGGLLGTGLSYLVAYAVRESSPLTPVITPGLIVMAFVFAAAVGLFFGAFPAWRAAKLDPIEALRQE